MKHPVWDRILILLCALAALSGAAGVVMLLIGKISLETIVALITSIDMSQFDGRGCGGFCVAVFVVVCNDPAFAQEAFQQLCNSAQ